MTIFYHSAFVSVEESPDCRSSSPQTKNMSSTVASQKVGGGPNYTSSSAARHLEESREALAWSLGRPLEVPILAASTLSSRVSNTTRLASTHANTRSPSTNPTVSCIPSLAATPPSSETVSLSYDTHGTSACHSPPFALHTTGHTHLTTPAPWIRSAPAPHVPSASSGRWVPPPPASRPHLRISSRAQPPQCPASVCCLGASTCQNAMPGTGAALDTRIRHIERGQQR